MAEILKIVNDMQRTYTIEDLWRQGLAVEFCNKKEYMEFMTTADSYGYNARDEVIWNNYLENEEFKHKYNGHVCSDVYKSGSFGFCFREYYIELEVKIIKYKDVIIDWQKYTRSWRK